MKEDKSWNSASDRRFVLKFKEAWVLIAAALAIGLTAGLLI